MTRIPRLLTAAAALSLTGGVVLAAEPPSSAPAGQAASGPGAELMRQWSRTCALCHVDGTGGAPRVGHPEEWAARLAQGREVLLDHTVNGLNNMPPLGYCMSCESDDFRALIDFMTGTRP